MSKLGADCFPAAWGLLDGAPDAALVVTAEGRIAFANARTQAMFGYTRAELVGAPLDTLISAHSREQCAGQLARCVGAASTPASPATLDLSGLTRDGREFSIEIAMCPSRITGEVTVIAFVRDVTTRVELAAALEDRERQLASIYDTVSDVLFQLAVEDVERYRFTSVNARFCAVTGLRADQVVGKYVDDVIPEPSLGLVKRRYAEAIREKRLVRWGEVSEYPTGTLTGEVCVKAVFDAQGRCTHIVGSVHDLTAIASDRMAAMGVLAANVAHEINNPLSVLIANLEVVSRDLSATPPVTVDELRDWLDDARQCAERIRTIVRDLKVFSRADDDKREPVDLEPVMESAIRMASNEIRHRARLVRQYGKVPPALANESRLGQVFLNLLVNAAHAIPEGKAELNEIRVTTRVGKNDDVIIEVADTGSGMTPEVRRQLFRPFFTTKPVGEGTGLGLSISHRIVTSLGGTIEVESEPGRGSVFRVHLPQARAEALRVSAPAPALVAAERRGRVLVVDDEPALGVVLKHVLSTDHETFTTTRASDALARVAAGERFDVILCDLMMPEMTGMDLYDALSRNAPEQAERVIFMTGGAFTLRAREFLDRVPNLKLEKPVPPHQLLELVNSRVR